VVSKLDSELGVDVIVPLGRLQSGIWLDLGLGKFGVA